MALIKCQECNKLFSEFAEKCPNCGMPRNLIHSTNNSCKYDVILQYMPQMYCGVFSNFMERNYNFTHKQSRNIALNLPSCLLEGIEYNVAEKIKNELHQFECNVSIVEHSDEQEKIKIIENKTEEIRCPRCGSYAISTGARGYSFWTGFLGSGKTVNRCAKCGNIWQPK